MSFLSDKHIELTSGEFGSDWLNTSRYVDALSTCYEQRPPKEPFVIGLFGEWGCGKTSIVTTFTKWLEDKGKTDIIYYDAWKYSGDSFRRTFLRQAQRDLLGNEDTQEDLDEVLYTTRKRSVKSSVLNVIKYDHFIQIAFVVAVIVTFLCVYYKVKFDATITFAVIYQYIALAYTFYNSVRTDMWSTTEETPLFSDEQFGDYFEKLMAKRSNKEKQVVVVVDNIDRCTPSQALRLLADIKNFLLIGDVCFIIPVDVDALQEGICEGEHLTDKQRRSSNEFIRKLFNVNIVIKPYFDNDLRKYTEHLSTENGLNLKGDTLALISSTFATNPRRIKQLLNNLSVELQMTPSDLREHETLICLLLIIREEFPELYKLLNQNAFLLCVSNNLYKDKNDEEISKLPTYTQEYLKLRKENSRLSSFLDFINPIAYRYSSSQDLFIQLATNTKKYDKIPQSVKLNITVGAVDKIVNYCEKNKEKVEFVFDYLKTRLSTAIKNEEYQTNIPSYVNILTEMNSKYPLNAKQLTEFLQIVGNDNHWSRIISNMPPLRGLIDLGVACEGKYINDDRVTKCVLEEINARSNTTDLLKDQPYTDVFYACSRIDKRHIDRDLIQTFAKCYKTAPLEALALDYGDKGSLLFTKELFNDLARSIDVGKIQDPASVTCQMVTLVQKQLAAQSELDDFLKALAEKIPEFQYDADNNTDNASSLQPIVSQLSAIYKQCGVGYMENFQEGITKLNEKICRTISVQRDDVSPGMKWTACYPFHTKETLLQDEFLEYFYWTVAVIKKNIFKEPILKVLLEDPYDTRIQQYIDKLKKIDVEI